MLYWLEKFSWLIPLAFSVEGGKSDIHIFKHCTALDAFWHGGGLALKTCAFHASWLVEWVMEVLRSITGSLISSVCTYGWYWWRGTIWGGMEVISVLCLCLLWLLVNWRSFENISFPYSKQDVCCHWDCHPSGRLKINFDGAYNVERNQVGTWGWGDYLHWFRSVF